MPCPTGTAVTYIGFTQIGQHLAIIFKILSGRAVYLTFRRSEILIDPEVKIPFTGIHKARKIAFWCYITIFVRPFVHIECMEVFAVDPEFVDKVGYLLVDRFGLAENKDDFFAIVGCRLDPVEDVHDDIKVKLIVFQYTNLEIRIRMLCDVRSFYVSASVQNFLVPEGNKFCWTKFEFLCAHLVSPKILLFTNSVN